LAIGALSSPALFGRAPGAVQTPAQAAPQRTRLEVPPGWTVFRGPGGLIVPHPAGWTIQERGDGGFVAFSPGPDGGAMAVVYVHWLTEMRIGN